MNESAQNASSIAREAKGLTQSLKDSLKKLDPWDREIEFQRANLRRQYLQLIFVHPYAKESKDADHSLWMTTSYYIIAAYKQRIAAADAVAHQSASDGRAHGRSHQQQSNIHGKPSGVVEHRKLVHRFRQFLAEEEKFWASLIVRAARVFDLEEAKPALVALGIAISETFSLDDSSSRNDRRNVFPNEDVTVTPLQNEKEQKLIMLSKALVCLGDIARYREHYNEGGGRPRAGKDFHDDAKSLARGRAGRRGAVEQPPRPRNYSKAQECYERARLLVPDVGNACHQLAILANYQQDPFASVLQFYRATCVKQPYETAAANLDNTLSRNLEGFRNTLTKREGGTNEPLQSPKLRVERFKKSLVALHGLWKLDPAQADTLLPDHAASVAATFSTLVAERVLPTDIIWKTLVLALGALWRLRVLRDPNDQRDIKGGPAIEARIFAHIMSLLCILFQIGSVQLTDASTSPEPAVNGTSLGTREVEADLAQNITAVFRRTLPALRIGSKWLCVHYSYLLEASSRLESQTDAAIMPLFSGFWASYKTFTTLLGRIFPVEKLPKMTLPLEEDVDVSGFVPLKRAMLDPSPNTASGLEPGQSQVHPNEEQLMRIADLLEDAAKIRGFTDSPTADKSIMHSDAPEARGEARQAESSQSLVATVDPGKFVSEGEIYDEDVHSEVDDDSATVSTKPDDDPVNLAMKAELPSDDDEMDQVVYLQSDDAPLTVPAPTNALATPSARSKPLSPPKALTAEDLVNEMLRPRGSSTLPPGSPLAAPLLFGSASPSAPTSIWSTTPNDSVSLSANNLRVTGYPGAQTRVSPPAMQSYTGLGQGSLPSAATPTRLTHQRQLSQPLAYPSGPPLPHGPWTSQGSSYFAVPQSSSQPRHTFSPPSAPFAPQQPIVNSRSFDQAHSPPFSQAPPVAQFQNAQQPQYSQRLQALTPPQVQNQFISSAMQAGMPSHSTWSYAGEGSLTGIGAPLGPFTADLPYSQPRIQQQAQMQRSGAWAPS